MKKLIIILTFLYEIVKSNKDLFNDLENGKFLNFQKNLKKISQEELSSINEDLLQKIREIQNNLIKLEKKIKSSSEIQKITPFFKWGQNSTHILINLKYSHREDSPGCLDVTNHILNVEDKKFFFSAEGHQSHRNMIFSLNLNLIKDISGFKFFHESVGTVLIVLEKKLEEFWDTFCLENLGKVWWELGNKDKKKKKGKVKKDIEEMEKDIKEMEKNMKKRKKRARKSKKKGWADWVKGKMGFDK